MNYQTDLKKYLQVIVGKRLDSLSLACEMMMFNFGEYALHAECLTRIIYEDDILVTTLDYQIWDGKVEENNDEWYFVKQYKSKIVGGVVISVEINSVHDVVIVLDNGIRIELFIRNGHNHFDDECLQWSFFKVHERSYPFVAVYNKKVDIAKNW